MYSTLCDLLDILNTNTKIQIGIIFTGAPRSSALILPPHHTIHTAPICCRFKEKLQKQCLDCRDRALQKAMTTKQSFFGICINGVGEYMHPIVIDGKVIGVIFIGNIMRTDQNQARIIRTLEDNGWDIYVKPLLESMEQNVSEERCAQYAKLIDSYFRLLYMQGTGEDHAPANTLMIDLINYIDENCYGELNLRQLAEVFHYSEKHLGRCINQYIGCSLKTYISKKRIEDAKRLLDNTELSISEIAVQTGFATIPYFTKRFRQFIGLTPTEYRKRK